MIGVTELTDEEERPAHAPGDDGGDGGGRLSKLSKLSYLGRLSEF